MENEHNCKTITQSYENNVSYTVQINIYFKRMRRMKVKQEGIKFCTNEVDFMK